MKNHIRLMAPLFYLAVVISAQKSQLFAFVGMENTHCEAPESVGNPKKDGSVFTFTVKMRCYAETSLAMTSLKSRFIEKTLQNTIHSRKDQFEYENMIGVRLDMTESLSMDHGDIETRYDSFIVGNKEKVLLNATSISIEATGDAKLTQSVHLRVEGYKKSDVIHIDFLKKVAIKKPWLAPKFIFISSATSGIKKDLKRISRFFLMDP